MDLRPARPPAACSRREINRGRRNRHAAPRRPSRSSNVFSPLRVNGFGVASATLFTGRPKTVRLFVFPFVANNLIESNHPWKVPRLIAPRRGEEAARLARRDRRASFECDVLEERILLFNPAGETAPFVWDASIGQDDESSDLNLAAVMRSVWQANSFSDAYFDALSSSLSAALGDGVAPATDEAAPTATIATLVQTTPEPLAVTTLESSDHLGADLDRDHDVDHDDFLLLKENFGTAEGDVNGDGVSDLHDFNELKRSFGYTTTQTIADPLEASVSRNQDSTFDVSFNRSVEGLDVSDFTLLRDGQVVAFSGDEQLSMQGDGAYVLSGLAEESEASGSYVLVLNKEGAADAEGGRLAMDATTAWSVEFVAPAATSVEFAGLPTGHATEPLNSVTLAFDAAVVDLSLSDLTLTREGGENLLGAGQSLITADGGRTWQLAGLDAVTTRAGVYQLSVNASVDGGEAIVQQDQFTVLAQIGSSDEFLRMIILGDHYAWQPERFTNIDDLDGETPLNENTRIRPSIDPGFWDSIPGIDLAPGEEPAPEHYRFAYEYLVEQEKLKRPDTVLGTYISSSVVKSPDQLSGLDYWPPSVLSSDDVAGAKLTDAYATSESSVGRVDINDPESLELLYQAHVREALGEGTRPKMDLIHYDEVAYTYADWDAYVELFSRLKETLNDQGVLVSINLGGWGWADPIEFISGDVVEEIIGMTNSVEIESVWSRNASAPGGSFRTVENTQKIVDNVRTVLDAGLTVELLPTSFAHDVNVHEATSIEEVVVDGESMLLVTTPGDHHIFPYGGRTDEFFRLSDLPPEYAGLEDVQWTAYEAPGATNQVLIKQRFESLESIKARTGISGSISLDDGQLIDRYASIRMSAAFAMLVREPGDSIFVHYSPGGAFPGEGDPDSPDNWFTWPEQLGAGVADYVVDEVAPNGEISLLHRDFERGRLWINPADGWVEIELFDSPAIT